MRRRLRLRSRLLLYRHARYVSYSFDARPLELSATGQSCRVVFGVKVAAAQLGALSCASGMRKVLLVRDREAAATSRARFIEFLLLNVGVPCFQFTLERDCATVKGVDEAVAMAQRVGADSVVAFGGGNTMDMARAVAVVMAQGGKAADYMTFFGTEGSDTDEREDLKLLQEKLETAPLLLVPTIAGSGAEVANRTLLLDEASETKELFAAGRAIVPKVDDKIKL